MVEHDLVLINAYEAVPLIAKAERKFKLSKVIQISKYFIYVHHKCINC